MNRTIKSKKKKSTQELKRDHSAISINFTGEEALLQVTSANSNENGEVLAGHSNLVVQDSNGVTLMTIDSVINNVKQTAFTGVQLLNVPSDMNRFPTNDPRYSEAALNPVFKIQGLGSNTPSPVATNPSFPLHCTIVGAQGVCDLVIIDTKKRETVIKQSIDGATEGFDLGMSGYLLGNVSYVGSTDGEINEHDVAYIDRHFGEHLGDVLEENEENEDNAA